MAYNDLPMGDKKIAQMISEGNTETSEALSALLDTRAINLPDKGENFYSKKTLKFTDFTAAIAGDSTGNATDEWIDLYMSSVATANPDLTVEIPHWNDSTQSYNAPTLIQTGTSTPPGTTFLDTFTRTAADLYQTQPDLGPVWGRDGSAAAGDWSIDGSKLVRTADATGSSMLADGQSAGDMRVSLSGALSTTNTGAARQFRIYLSYAGSTNNLYVQITVSTTGSASLSINKRIDNAFSTIYSGSTGVLTANTASVPFTASVSRTGAAISFTVNTTTVTANLAPEDIPFIDGGTMAGFSGGVMAGDWLDNFKIESLTTSVPVKLTLLNASMSGSQLSYQLDRLSTLYPADTKIDVLFISSCHNYGGLSAEAYTAQLDTFIKAYRALHPESGIIISSQNPQKAPATYKTPHLVRLAALKSYAAKRGYGYLPVIEAFKNSTGGGIGLVAADGVHPTPGASNSGSSLWRDTVINYFNNL